MFMPRLVQSNCAFFLGALALASLLGATETPFTPYKDGYASPSTYTGNSRTLLVRHPDSKAWVSHPIGDGTEKGVSKARLQVYVKDVVREGKLRVFLKSAVDRLENQTRYGDITAADSLGDSVAVTMKDVQRVVNIPLGSAFLKDLANYDGIVLEGDDGLEAELGALEGGHGTLLYLTYGEAFDSTLVKSVAQELVRNHLSEIKGRDGTNGLKGSDGTPGTNGAPGSNGAPGKDGENGKDGKPGDSTLVFRLLQDRSYRAYYAFDRFGTSNGNRTTPDSSGNGNDLTLSANGTNLRANAPGDSVVEFLGNGYAVASNSLSLSPYREIMISARVKLSSDAPPDTQVILSKGGQYEVAVIRNRLVCRFKTVLGNWEWLGGGSVPNGVWVTVGAGYDGKAVRTFVDGVQTSYLRFTNGPLAMEPSSLYVGAINSSGDWGFKGVMDQVKITSYMVNIQDSLATLPGQATMAQVVADSVTGLKALLDTKANLSGANFTGKIGIGTDNPLGKLHIAGNELSPGVNRAFISLEDSSSGGRWNIAAFGTGSYEGGKKFGINQAGVANRFVTDSIGHAGVGTVNPGVSKTQGRTYFTVAGQTAAGVVEMTTPEPDSAGTRVGLIQFSKLNTSAPEKRIGYLLGAFDGKTAGDRGGRLEFGIKSDSGLLKEAMRITEKGWVGIGTTNPRRPLSLNGGFAFQAPGGAARNIHWGDEDTDIWPIWIGGNAQNGSEALTFSTNTFGNMASERMRITSSGNVGIGTSTPGFRLEVAGTAANPTGQWAVGSDRRLKRDIQPLQGSLEKILALQGVSFHWIDHLKDNTYGLQRGFIAQDVEKVIPEWVKTDAVGYKSLEKVGVEAVLVEAIKEQQKQIENLKQIVCTDHPYAEMCRK